jgi:hypothetical protein
MQMRDLIRQNRSALQQRCFDLVISSYGDETQDFFRRQKDRFLNPIGAALSRQIEALFDLVLAEDENPDGSQIFADFVQIRAVQDFAPSQAVGFVLCLKQAIRERLAEKISTESLFAELLAVETRIDRLLLQAFDAYMSSREKIYEVRANDLKRKSFLALKISEA